MRILKRLAECRPMLGKFRGQRIRIRRIHKRIQPQVGMPRMVRHRRHATFRLNKNLRSIAPDDRKKWIPRRRQEPRLKAQPLAVKSNCLLDVAHNKARGNCFCQWSIHMPPFLLL